MGCKSIGRVIGQVHDLDTESMNIHSPEFEPLVEFVSQFRGFFVASNQS